MNKNKRGKQFVCKKKKNMLEYKKRKYLKIDSNSNEIEDDYCRCNHLQNSILLRTVYARIICLCMVTVLRVQSIHIIEKYNCHLY